MLRILYIKVIFIMAKEGQGDPDRRQGSDDEGFDGQFRRVYRVAVDEEFPEGLGDEERAAIGLEEGREEFVGRMSQPFPELALGSARDGVRGRREIVTLQELQQQNAALEQDNTVLLATVESQTSQFQELAERVHQIGEQAAVTEARADSLLGLSNEEDGLREITIQLKLLQREGVPTNISFIVFSTNGTTREAFVDILTTMQNRDNDIKFMTDDGNNLILFLSGCDERDATLKAREIAEEASQGNNGINGKANIAVSTFVIRKVNGHYEPDASRNLELALGAVNGGDGFYDRDIYSTRFAQDDKTGAFKPYEAEAENEEGIIA
jgi:hypothetical protein